MTTFDLGRFTEAQSGTYSAALGEIKSGKKRTHWMWFIFPQIAGLGSSPMARKYAIGSTAEALAFLNHPVLGPRLLAISRELIKLDSNNALDVMGDPDHLKLQSSMTLFHLVAPAEPVFREVLNKFYQGQADKKTIQILNEIKI